MMVTVPESLATEDDARAQFETVVTVGEGRFLPQPGSTPGSERATSVELACVAPSSRDVVFPRRMGIAAEFASMAWT